MEKLIFLFLLVILPFVVHQDASALTISAIPVKQEFGANEWIKVNVTIQGYNGGQINWVAHRPDNSTISGVLDQQTIRSGRAIHQIIRDANDNEFGSWSINYGYGGSNQTVQVNVKSLGLTVITDKITYYEPDTMNINITSSYYSPYAKFAHSYFLDFYDQDGNEVIGVTEIEVKADQPSVTYHLPMLQFAKYNPAGLYNLKIQYFNSVKYVPFLLGDINKLMEISVTNSATYYPGSNIGLDLTFSKLTESSGTIKITDPLGNITSSQFYPQSILYTLTLNNLPKIIGTYNFEIDYAGITKTGSFKIVQNPLELPNIKLDIFPNKLNYRPGEISNFEIQISNITTNSISTWVTDPNGNTSPVISLPLNTTEIIIPHKIAQNDSKGVWKLYVNYDGIIKNSSFYVDDSPIDSGNALDAVQYNIPIFVSAINSTTFDSPTSIAIDHDNNTYIVDSGNSKIKKFDDKNRLLVSWGDTGSSNGQFKNPSGIFVNENYVYVADSGNSRIIMFNKTGSFVYSWGTYGNNPGMFEIPTAINSDHSNDLVVGDMEQGSIQLFDTKGTYEDKIDSSSEDGADFSGIKALAFDSKDNLYAISTDDKILKYSRIGKFLNWYGSIGNEDGRFNNPSAIAIDSKDNIYVADTGNHRIQKLDSHGNFLWSWNMKENGQQDGFEQPVGLAIDTADNIYVVDKTENSIQKFALYGGTNKNILPSWIKNTAIWWAEGILDKKDFSQSVRYVISQGIIKTPSMSPSDIVKIPSWLKGNVKQWYSGQIDDNTFWASIQHLLSIGAMKI